MRAHGAALRLLILLVAAWPAAAQAKLTVEQLTRFIESSLRLRHDDKQVANYLKKVALSERLDERTVETLQGLGVGPKTLEALGTLVEATRGLPAPPKVEPKPAAPVIPPPTPEEQRRILTELRDYALNYTRRLPDFICTQVTRRYVDPSGLEFWQRQDVITARLSYFENREEYKVMLVNGRMSELPMDQLGGATSTGEFGSMLKEIFEPATEADFAWQRWATLRSRRMHVYSYNVRQDRSKWNITYDRRLTIVPAYRGLVFVDRDTLMVMRITLEALNIPLTFPIQMAKTTLDYDYTKISDREFVLPLRAEVRMREGKFLVKNEVEFRLYRKFGAEATITFDTPEPLPDSATREQPVKPPPP